MACVTLEIPCRLLSLVVSYYVCDHAKARSSWGGVASLWVVICAGAGGVWLVRVVIYYQAVKLRLKMKCTSSQWVWLHHLCNVIWKGWYISA